MALLSDETWDDFEGKDVFVTSTSGKDGFRGGYISYNEETKMVRVINNRTNKIQEVPEKFVYGLWMLEDW